MTGNDSINARFLHCNSFDFRPQFKLYINTNYLPSVDDMSLFSSIVCASSRLTGILNRRSRTRI